MKKLYFIFTVLLTLAFFFIIPADIAQAITVTASPKPAQVNQRVSVKVNVENKATFITQQNCTVQTDFGDSTPPATHNCRFSGPETCSRTLSHKYTNPGTYTITSSTSCGPFIASPNPATTRFVVSMPADAGKKKARQVKVRITSASKRNPSLEPGKSVTLTLKGSNLNRITSAQVLQNNRPVRKVKAKLGPGSATSRKMTLKANANAKAGNYQLRLTAGKQVINIPARVVQIVVTTPKKMPVVAKPKRKVFKKSAVKKVEPKTYKRTVPKVRVPKEKIIIDRVPKDKVIKKVEVTSVKSGNRLLRSVSLVKGGGAAIIIVNGKNLNNVTSVEVLNARGVTASFRHVSATKLQVTLKASANANPGNYQLQFKDKKGQVINIPARVVQVGVKAPRTVTPSPPSPPPQTVTSSPSPAGDITDSPGSGLPPPPPPPPPTCSALIITTTSPLPSGTVGQAYSQQIQASGGQPPITYTLDSGTLPPGLDLSAAGVISGTPTSTGTFNFTIKATDRCSKGALRIGAGGVSQKKTGLDLSKFKGLFRTCTCPTGVNLTDSKAFSLTVSRTSSTIAVPAVGDVGDGDTIPYQPSGPLFVDCPTGEFEPVGELENCRCPSGYRKTWEDHGLKRICVPIPPPPIACPATGLFPTTGEWKDCACESGRITYPANREGFAYCILPDCPMGETFPSDLYCDCPTTSKFVCTYPEGLSCCCVSCTYVGQACTC